MKNKKIIFIISEGKVVSDFEQIDDILDVLNGVKRITQKESIQDSPVNVENEIKIDFISENRTLTVFVYKNDTLKNKRKNFKKVLTKQKSKCIIS